MLLGFYILSVVALPLVVGACAILGGLPRTRRCPRCTGETIRLRSRRHAFVGWFLTGDLHLRWCPSCAWQGAIRVEEPGVGTDASRRLAARRVGPAPKRPQRPGGVSIRSVDIDGDVWHVQVQCWAEGAVWRGRLIFVGPAGRSLCEYEPRLTGSSALEVISIAIALPESNLIGRIRRASR